MKGHDMDSWRAKYRLGIGFAICAAVAACTISNAPEPEEIRQEVERKQREALTFDLAPAGGVTRILTWNVHTFDDIWHVEFPEVAGPLDAGLRAYEKAPHIARHILEQKYDIVLFNEAWTEDIKVPLTNLLSRSDAWAEENDTDIYKDYVHLQSSVPQPALGAMPYWVADTGVDSATDFYNSGLMLFSRFKPAPFPIPTGVDGKFYPNGPGAPSSHYECAHTGNTTLEPTEVSASAFSAHPDFLAIDTYSNATTKCSLASFEYSEDSGWDADSSKAVVWMRVFDSNRGRPINIFATHTQAGNGETEVDIRDNQLAEALAFIRFLGLQNEEVILAGDLNVIEFSDTHVTPPVVDVSYSAWLSEGGSFPIASSPKLHDAFRTHLRSFSIDPDFGMTTNNDRLDYFMTSFLGHNDSSNTACAQHVRKRNDFVAYTYSLNPPQDLHAGAYLSDHRALEMTIGSNTGNCSPARALNNPSDATYNMQIPDSGGYQWIRVPANRTALLNISPMGGTAGGPVAVDMFRADNISDAIAAGWPVNVTGNGTSVIEAYPFDHYLRLRAANGAATGSFTVKVTTPTGASEDQAWPLSPRVFEGAWQSDLTVARDQYAAIKTQPLRLTAPTSTSPGQASVFYRFHLETPTFSPTQHVVLHVAQANTTPLGEPMGSGAPTLTVAATLTRVLPDGTHTPIKSFSSRTIPTVLMDGPTQYRYMLLEVDIPASDENATYVLSLTRNSVATEQAVRVGYETNLRVLELPSNALTAVSDNDDFPGDLDEPVGALMVDAVQRFMLYRGIDEHESFLLPFAWLDASLHAVSPGVPHASTDPSDKLLIKFTSKVSLDWAEHDTAGDDVADFASDIGAHLYPNGLGFWYYSQDVAKWESSSFDYVGGAPRTCLLTGCAIDANRSMQPDVGHYATCFWGPDYDLGNFDCDARYDVRAKYRLPL